MTRGRRPRCFLARSRFGKKRVAREGGILIDEVAEFHKSLWHQCKKVLEKVNEGSAINAQVQNENSHVHTLRSHVLH